MKNYTTVAKSVNPPYHWFILSNEINTNDCPLETKKINEKHEDILYAYLKDINVKIEVTNYIPKYSDIFLASWHDEENFIDNYSENLEYRLKIENPKNNFKDYGFEADFEGEIFTKYQDELYGVVYRESGNNWVVIWGSTGRCYNNDGDNITKYNLKPIKKEWYENPDNFPCIATKDGKNFAVIESIDYLKRVCIYQDKVDFRPATPEEALSLLVKED